MTPAETLAAPLSSRRGHGTISRDDEELKGSYFTDFGFPDAVLDTCIVQLRALGLITESRRKRGIHDTRAYWSLTPFGGAQLVHLRDTHHRETRDARTLDAAAHYPASAGPTRADDSGLRGRQDQHLRGACNGGIGRPVRMRVLLSLQRTRGSHCLFRSFLKTGDTRPS